MIPQILLAGAYQASSLHDSVRRTTTVYDVFQNRWNEMEKNNSFFDIFANVNRINGFQIYVPDKQVGGDAQKTAGMTLTRAFGGASVLLPLSIFSESSNDYLGFTLTGYYYGLENNMKINRGTLGNEEVKDYRYGQFFDDIIALTYMKPSYLLIHGGILLNNTVEPRDDGTMSVWNSSDLHVKWFLSATLLSVFTIDTINKGNIADATNFELKLTTLYSLFFGKLPSFVPEIKPGIKITKQFTDSAYNAVWVHKIKSDTDKRESARLTLFTLGIDENIADFIFFTGYFSWQKPSKTLIEKRTDERIHLKPLKEFRAALGIDILFLSETHSLVPEFGYSHYWDETLPLHSDSHKYAANGLFGSLSYTLSIAMIDVKAFLALGRNDSNELKTLIEYYDKDVFKWGFSVTMNYSGEENTPW